MNEEITKKLIEYIQMTEKFVYEQAPEIIRELLIYKYYSNLFGMIIYILLFCFFAYVFIYKYFNPEYDDSQYITSRSLMTSLISGIICIILFVSLIICFESFMQIKYAPKLYILEYLTNLKGNK